MGTVSVTHRLVASDVVAGMMGIYINTLDYTQSTVISTYPQGARNQIWALPVCTGCYIRPVEPAASGRTEAIEAVARVTSQVGSLPVPFFGCEADTLEVFVDDLSTVSAFADEDWELEEVP